jgi:hypothetical protein
MGFQRACTDWPHCSTHYNVRAEEEEEEEEEYFEQPALDFPKKLRKVDI